VPEVCDLYGYDTETVEKAAESVHLAVADCAEKHDVDPPNGPPRWLVFRVEKGKDKRWRATPPREPWSDPLAACLLRRKVNVPKGVRASAFSAWFLLVNQAGEKPAHAACQPAP
jgi:hypothetical protein